MKETIHVHEIYDSEGKQMRHSVIRKLPNLGSGWITMYKKAIKQIIKECDRLSTLKVYLHLASKQTFNKFVMTTSTQIIKDLGLSKRMVLEALKWLQDKGYIQKHNVEGNTGYLLNPKQTTCGVKTKPSKERLWAYKVKLDAVEGLPAKLDEDIQTRQTLIDKYNELIEGEIHIDDEEGDDDDAGGVLDEEESDTVEDVQDDEAYRDE